MAFTVMAVTITDRFATSCAVVYNNNYDTCGTITRSSIDYLTPADLEALFSPSGLFADLDAWFFTSIEMKACGTKVYGMYEWIMSGAKRDKGKLLNTIKADKGPSLLQPFILGRQLSVINTTYWTLTNGWANSAYTAAVTGPLTAGDKALGAAGDRVVRVVSPYGLVLESHWFVDRDIVHIFTRAAGVSQQGTWKVLASEAAADGTYIDVLITTQNAGSDVAYKTDPGASATGGVLVPGTNNVNDYEKWCNNRPNWDGRKRVPFWFKTMRRTRCVDEQYLEYFKRLMQPGVNRAFKEFGDIDLAERNAQDELEWKRRFAWDFFYAKPLNANQTLALWESLPDINTPTGFSIDPGTGGKIRAKRAEFVGIVEQMRLCDRVRDLQNNPLNFYEWLRENYNIKRSRASQNRNVTDIDWYTDSEYAAVLETGFLNYYKAEYGDILRIPFGPSEAKSNDLGFSWKTFRVKWPGGININIITHEFFDDLRNINRDQSQESVGVNLWAIDWETIYWAQLATNKKIHSVGDIEKLAALDKDFACVMEGITQQVTLISETGTAVNECPNNSLFIWGINPTLPDTSGEDAAPGDTDLY